MTVKSSKYGLALRQRNGNAIWQGYPGSLGHRRNGCYVSKPKRTIWAVLWLKLSMWTCTHTCRPSVHIQCDKQHSGKVLRAAQSTLPCQSQALSALSQNWLETWDWPRLERDTKCGDCPTRQKDSLQTQRARELERKQQSQKWWNYYQQEKTPNLRSAIMKSKLLCCFCFNMKVSVNYLHRKIQCLFLVTWLNDLQSQEK